MKAALLICLCIASLSALDPPQPIRGNPTFTIGKRFTTTSGNTTFSFTFPDQWGFEEMSASEKKGSFTLFPNGGGYGCKVEISQLASEVAAKEEVERLKGTFAMTSPIADGFEAALKNAKYACYANERYVNEIWYSLPHFTSENEAVWEQLKKCVTTSEAKLQAEEGWVPLKEIPFKGWVCNHPNNQLHVFVKSNVIDKVTPTEDPTLLQIEDIKSSGFFYLKWDQKDLENFAPYQTHLNEIKAHVLKIEKGQRFEREPVFVKEDGIAFLRGTPYTIISLSGDDFLFGFALKNKAFWRDLDINSYIKRVEWWTD